MLFNSKILLKQTMFGNRKEKVELLEALVVSDKDATITDPNYSQVCSRCITY